MAPVAQRRARAKRPADPPSAPSPRRSTGRRPPASGDADPAPTHKAKHPNGKGSIRRRRESWEVRLSLPGGRRPFRLPGRWAEADAQRRRELLCELADRLVAAGQLAVGLPLLERAAVTEGGILAGVQKAIDLLCQGRTEGELKKEVTTFADIANAWVSGELRARFPDHVRPLKTARKHRGNFNRHILPLVGQVPIYQFKIEHAELVMRNLPESHSVGMRSIIALRMNGVLNYAVYPLKVIESNPIPRGWAPKSERGSKAYGHLYPDEEALLIGCVEIELVFRVYYGFLSREGMRCDTEAGVLEWKEIDFVHGVVRLDKNKTNRPRAWKLSPDTLRALSLWRKLAPPGPFVFVGPRGGDIHSSDACDRFREHLRIAGITRPELFEHNARRQRLRLHDLRATFVTVRLANGWTETQVMDRTGHTTSTELNRYRRAARNLRDLHQSDFVPMDLAIPELRALAESEGGGGQGAGGGPGAGVATTTTTAPTTTGRESRTAEAADAGGAPAPAAVGQGLGPALHDEPRASGAPHETPGDRADRDRSLPGRGSVAAPRPPAPTAPLASTTSRSSAPGPDGAAEIHPRPRPRPHPQGSRAKTTPAPTIPPFFATSKLPGTPPPRRCRSGPGGW